MPLTQIEKLFDSPVKCIQIVLFQCSSTTDKDAKLSPLYTQSVRDFYVIQHTLGDGQLVK